MYDQLGEETNQDLRLSTSSYSILRFRKTQTGKTESHFLASVFKICLLWYLCICAERVVITARKVVSFPKKSLLISRDNLKPRNTALVVALWKDWFTKCYITDKDWSVWTGSATAAALTQYWSAKVRKGSVPTSGVWCCFRHNAPLFISPQAAWQSLLFLKLLTLFWSFD